MDKRITQLENEISGLQSQQRSRDRQEELIEEELESVLALYAKDLTPITRKNALEREAANLSGQEGQLTASIARAQGRIAETRLQISEIDDKLREEVSGELRDIQAKVAELSERRVAAQDQLKRIDIRAPRSGFVHQLAVHTVGGVINPAEPAMLIVPEGSQLLVDARVEPHDIDQVRPGGDARIRIRAFNQRTTPELVGKVARISANTSVDEQSGVAFYSVMISLDHRERARLGKDVLSAGMQADVFITTSNRTPFEYLIKPLTDQFAKTFRER